MRRVAYGGVVVVAVGCCAAASVASAQSRRTLGEALVVTSTDACLTQAAIVEQAVMWRDVPDVAPTIGLSVAVEARDVTLRVEEAGAEVARRTFERLPRRCEDRRAFVALAVALALGDAEAAVEARDAATPAAPSPLRESIAVPIAPIARAAARPAGSPHGLAVELGVGLGVSAPTSVAAAAGRIDLNGALGFGGWALRVRGRLGLTSQDTLDVGRVDVRARSIDLTVCPALTLARRAAVETCAGPWFAEHRVRGRGFAIDRTARLRAVGALVRVGVSYEIATGWFLEATADVGYTPVDRYVDVVAENGAISRYSVGSIEASVGGGARVRIE